jgi:serine/threonine protein kinase
MKDAHGYHPSAAQLRAFDIGQLSADEQDPVARHLERCPECCQTLDTLPEDPLVALMRAFAGRSEASPEAAAREQAPAAAALAGHPRYRVLEVLGAGGMGVVYKAVHRLMDRVVALKVLDRRLTERPAFVERFRAEVRAAARLAHPNIVTAYDADQAGATHFLVMEHVAGISLEMEIERRGPLPVSEACDLIHQAALGLQHAHERGMVHRDIKPANLLLTLAGQVKILDFGLARLVEEDSGTATPLPSAVVLGTPDYVAPEQARDPAHADIRADVYSLGCTLYHLLAGRPPFPGGTPLRKLLAQQECKPPALAETRADVPEALAAILERMLAKDPARRYPTPAAVAADLARFADPDPAPPPTPRRRSLGGLLTLATVPFAAVGALALAGYLPRPEERRPTPVELEAPRAPTPRAPTPPPVTSLEEETRQKTVVRDRAMHWLQRNNSYGPDHVLVADVRRMLDKDLPVSEAFQVLLGPKLVKSAKATLLVGRAGTFGVFELSPAQTSCLPAKQTYCWMMTHKKSDDLRRVSPRLQLSGLNLERADALVPERPVAGSVDFRVLDRWQGECSLRLTCYLGARRRMLLLPYRVPVGEQGTLHFSFKRLGKPKEFEPGPYVVFLEWVTHESGRMVVESNAAAAVVQVPPPEADGPSRPK